MSWCPWEQDPEAWKDGTEYESEGRRKGRQLGKAVRDLAEAFSDLEEAMRGFVNAWDRAMRAEQARRLVEESADPPPQEDP